MRLIFKPPTIFASPSTEWETWTKIFTLHRFSHFPPGLRLAAGLPVAWQPGKLLRVSRPAFGSRLRKSPRWSSFFFSEKFRVRNQSEKTIFRREREWSKNEREQNAREKASLGGLLFYLCCFASLRWVMKLSFRKSFRFLIAGKLCTKFFFSKRSVCT